MTTRSLKPGEQPAITVASGRSRVCIFYAKVWQRLLNYSTFDTCSDFSCNVCLCCSSSPRGPSTSPSAHSISTPEKNRFPRGTTSRSTFHGAQLRDRRSATYNGPPASPTLSHDTGALAQQRRGTSTGIISKITSKFVRRSVKTNGCTNDSLGCA